MTPWFSSPVVNLNIEIYYWYVPGSLTVYRTEWWRPYFRDAVGQNVLISYDYLREDYTQWGGSSFTDNRPYADAYNTNRHLSSMENLCTSGFFFVNPFIFKPSNVPTVPTELFVATVGNPWPYSTASADTAIYRDTVHKQNQIQNIILDTIARRVYLIFNNNMTILGYQSQIVSVADGMEKPAAAAKGIFVIPNLFSSGVTIVLPAHAASVPADLYFYDLSGRVIDRMRGVTSHAVLWQPKTRSMSCYIVSARIGTERLTRKFMVR